MINLTPDNSGTLDHVLDLIALQVHADAKELKAYAAEDNIGGYHIEPALRLWPMGSMWGVEGQIIYALIRYFKPEMIAEIGGWAGASATHMATAVKLNGKGHIISVDNGVGGMAHGHLIPDELRKYVTLIPEDGRIWLNHQPPNSIDFLFEDADHSTSLVEELARLALSKVRKDGLYLAHDAMHAFALVGGNEPGTYAKINSPVGDYVQDGLRGAGLYFYGYLAEPSDCGLAIAVMPGNKTAERLSAPKASEESINNSPPKVNDQWDIKEYVGSANIESVSTPPAPLQAQEKQSEPKATEDNPIVRAEVKEVEKKPRGKGRKKAE